MLTNPYLCTQKKYKVRVLFVPKACEYDKSRKGCNKITPKELEGSFYYDQNANAIDDYDVTIIVGFEDGGTAASVLLCRFHKFDPCIANPRALLIDLQKELTNKYERRRVGGSSGFMTYSEELMKGLLGVSNSSPRASKGAVWLRDKDNLKIHLLYFSTKECELKDAYYTTPRPGGSFQMTEELMEKYHFLHDFIATKPLAAAIFTEIESMIGNYPNLPQLKICTIAVKHELQNAEIARHFVKTFIKKYNRRKASKERYKRHEHSLLFYRFYAIHFLNFTLVMHPVGGHLDVFADKQPSLENRVCFSFDLDQNGRTGIQHTGYRYGRGGAGMNKFCFALLDWGGYKRQRSRAWIHEDNAHLPHSAAEYARQNRNATQRCTDAIWARFLRANGRQIRHFNHE